MTVEGVRLFERYLYWGYPMIYDLVDRERFPSVDNGSGSVGPINDAGGTMALR